MGQIQTERPALQKSLADLKAEVEQQRTANAAGAQNAKLMSVLQKHAEEISSSLDAFASLMKAVEEEVLWWGEPDASNIGEFYGTWLKFVQTFQKIVKYNQEQAKREATKKEKAAKAERKAATKPSTDTLNKFANDVARRSSRRADEQLTDELMKGLSVADKREERRKSVGRDQSIAAKRASASGAKDRRLSWKKSSAIVKS